MHRIRLIAVATAVAAVAMLCGCAPTLDLEPADSAADPACADVTVRLPDTVADLTRRSTDAQATAAWGDPAGVLLYCGVEVPSASTLTCIDVAGYDWLLDDTDPDAYVLRLYGREPAIDVVLDAGRVDPASAIDSLASAVSRTSPNGHACLDRGDIS